VTERNSPAPDSRLVPIAKGPRRPPDEVLELPHGFVAEIYQYRRCSGCGVSIRPDGPSSRCDGCPPRSPRHERDDTR
jgi:hypothetical protein